MRTLSAPLIAKCLGGLLAVTATIAAVQTVRINGLPVIGGGLRAELTQLTKTLKAEREGWSDQIAEAESARATFERQSQEIAHHAEQTHATLAADNAGLRDFIAANRMRPTSPANAATSSSEHHSAGLSEITATHAIVATSEADLIICDANYTYAAAAHEWATALITSGMAQ